MVTLDEDNLSTDDKNPSAAATKVVSDLNKSEASVDKCTQQLNNDVETRIEELQNCSEAFSDEFEENYKDDIHNTNPIGFDPDDAFGDGSNSCNDLDDYKSGDDNRDKSDDDIFEEQACIRYEKSAGGFEFSCVGDKIVLRPGQLFVNMREFRKILKVFVIRNGFRLERLKNDNTRVTYVCAAQDCTWRIHTSLNWDQKSFQIKTYYSEHICPRVDNNYKSTSDQIAATYLHLFNAIPNIKISVLATTLTKRYGIECNNKRLYMAKRKALELICEDSKTSYSKLFKYAHALLNSNHVSTVCLERDWLSSASISHIQEVFFYIQIII